MTLFTTRYIVLSTLGPEQAGLLQAQLGLALTVGAVVAPMSALYLAPLVNRQTPTAERVAAANGFSGRVILLLLFAGLPFILFPRFALGTLFSPAFEPAAHFFFVFLAWQFVYQVSNIYLQLLIGLDDVWFFAGITCAGYAVAVVLLPFLVPGMGTGGVGLALVAAMAVTGFGAALRLHARFGQAIGAAVWLRFGYLATVLIGAGLWFSPETELEVRGIVQRAAFAAFALSLAWWTLTAEERNRLRRVLSRASKA